MGERRAVGRLSRFLALTMTLALAGLTPGALAQTTAAAPVRPETAFFQALQANPITAPFRVQLTAVGGHYVLTGRVGSKQAHDAVVRTAIALGIVARDDLVIDTTEAYRAAAEGRWNGTNVPLAAPLPSYVYPPLLMGRVDDPFYGMEPPLVSYPPWWRGVAAREPLNLAAIDAATDPNANPGAGGNVAVPSGSVLLTLDQRGVALLRGTVPTEAQKIEIGQKVAGTPGVNQVVNELQVDPNARSIAGTETPPPLPHPSSRPAEPARPAEAIPPPPRPEPPPADPAEPPRPVVRGAPGAGDGSLASRVSQSLARRPALASLPLTVASRDGEVTLTGGVPSAYEAMLAFRAAEQTPGVRSVVDQLSFSPPDVDRPNPLKEKARPDDLVPYVTAHLRRQLGDLAHVDRVELHADTIEIRGTVARADDTARVEAALRSIPILRGVRLDPHFLVD